MQCSEYVWKHPYFRPVRSFDRVITRLREEPARPRLSTEAFFIDSEGLNH